MDIIEAIKTRKSIRAFKKKKVTLTTIEKILELASFSPSGSNTQPWNVHVLYGKSLEKFTKEMTTTVN